MHRRAPLLLRSLSVLLTGTVAMATAAAQPNSRATNLALVGGTLIDGNGGVPVRNSVVLVADGRITAVGIVGQLAVPAGATVLRTTGMTVLPGLFESHAHLMLAGHGNYAHGTARTRRVLQRT